MDRTDFELSPDTWRQVQRLFVEALRQPPEQRTVFLDTACAGPQLRAEVVSLLAAHKQAEGFLDALSPDRLAALLDPGEGAEVVPTVGPYRIVRELGRGGMGVVYLAEDVRLDRRVALKFLPPHLAADARAKRRLVTEAKAAAALDHPGVAVVHEIGETEAGQLFIAMAYVEGETLQARLHRGPLPVEEAAGLARQIAGGLGAAHRRGIIHRDVKPSNVLITPEVIVKLVDFGIAKVDCTDLTEEGTVPGTVAYMSPEQTRGEALDARTDLWSLGVVLYEMLVGVRPFRGSDEQAVIYAIRHDAPEPVGRLRTAVPDRLAAAVARCLEKDPERRYASAEDLLADLDADGAGSASPGPRRVVAPSSNRLAVLPLDSYSPDSADAYFADGMTEELIARLSRLDALRVIARTSVVAYRGTTKGAAQIGRELGVGTLLQGSVRKTGGRVRIAVQLIDTASQEHLWAEDFDAEVEDVLGVQRAIAERVAEALHVRLHAGERQRLGKRGTAHAAAYDHYLKGRHLLNKWEKVPLEEARDHFQQALDIDPTFAGAWAGLADVHVVFGYLALLTPEETYARGRAAAERALALDEELAEAHSALASVLTDYSWDWETAEHHFRRAIALDPSYALAHQYFAECLRDQGRFDEALTTIQQAKALDPLSPYVRLVEGAVLWLARRYDDAVTHLRSLLTTHGPYPPAHLFLGLAYLDIGEYEEALAELDRGDPSRTQPDAVGPRGMAYARMGRRAEAEGVLEELTALSGQCYVSPFLPALIHIDLGERDQAFPLLEQACEERSWFVRLLKVLPSLDPLRSDPRLQVLLRKVGLAA